jgi:hypothetical protein
MNPIPAPPERPLQRLERLVPLAAGFLALAPLVLLHSEFAKLFWFGDDWDLLDQIQRFGFWHWTWQVFAENFVPVFKALWGGSAYFFHGGYFWMIVVLWLTHAVNTMQLGRVLRTFDFSWPAVLFTQIIFGLTCINIETLGWSVQWSAVLATTFLLFALEWQERRPPQNCAFSWRTQGALVALSAASALCFSRGVLTGAMLAAASLWPATRAGAFSRRFLHAALYLLPALITAALIMIFASGNQQHLRGHGADITIYGLWYFCLNPLHRLLEFDSWGLRTVWLIGVAKVALIVWGLRHSQGRQRLLLVLLLAFDLGNSVLLGIGRYHTGIETTISSRYQYSSLLCVLPFAGLAFAHLLGKVPSRFRLRTLTTATLLLVIAWSVSRNWPQEIHGFAFGRGTETRRILTVEPNPPAMGAIPGIPFLSTVRAKELVRIYNLH